MRAVSFDFLLWVCNSWISALPSSRLRHWFYRRVMQLQLHPTAHILGGLWLDGRRNLSIGKHSVINQRCRLDNRGGIVIGDEVSISPEVHILTADHDVYTTDFRGREKPVRIEDHVFIGSRATVLPGVTLGRGCAVGAGSIVTKDVPPYCVVAGNPAKQIGIRPNNLQYKLEGKRHFF
jgi:acetyltransferase-like isoleucine patch superfamily enzyme